MPFLPQHIRDLVLVHGEENVADVAMSSDLSRLSVDERSLVLEQIEGRQRAKIKVPEFAAHPEVVYPRRLSMEQCSSVETAIYKRTLARGEQRMADLTSGFGIDLYYISQVFFNASYVEADSRLCDIAKNNFDVLGRKNIEVHNTTAEDFIGNIEDGSLDLVFIDPARRDSAGRKMVGIEDCTPNIVSLSSMLQKKSKRIMAKLSPMLDISVVIKSLSWVKEVHIMSVNSECKELLALSYRTDGRTDNDEVGIFATDIVSDGYGRMINTLSYKDGDRCAVFANDISKYLYEPNSSVMKSRLFGQVCSKWDLKQIERDTSLFTSDTLKRGFYGRVFEVVDVFGLSKDEVKRGLNGITKANVAVRNFPMTAESLSKRLKLKDGGDVYLFGLTARNGQHLIARCTKVSDEL